jgi:hypothetical protein
MREESTAVALEAGFARTYQELDATNPRTRLMNPES